MTDLPTTIETVAVVDADTLTVERPAAARADDVINMLDLAVADEGRVDTRLLVEARASAEVLRGELHDTAVAS